MVPPSTHRKQRQNTLHDVAREAGVSIMTVSNVINGKFNMMNKETRETVEKAVVRLKYRPDTVGRGLRLSRRFSLGLLVVDPSPTFIADYFTTLVSAGLSNSLSQKGYGLVVQGVSSEKFTSLATLRAGGTDALCVVISGTSTERRLLRERLAELDHPFVIIQDEIPEQGLDAMAIRQDDFSGGCMLGERLAAQGCRDAVFLCEHHPWPALEYRAKGMRSALGKAGVKFTVVKAKTAGIDDVQNALARHAARAGMPDAVLGGNDQIGIAALLWLQAQGAAVPDQVKVTGFNGFEFARFAVPRLTTVRSSAYEIGSLAAAAVLARLETGTFASRETVLPVALEEGGSA